MPPKMRDIRLEPCCSDAVDDAFGRWKAAERAWEAIEYALSRDPEGAGTPINEPGTMRFLVYDGARSIDMPDMTVIFEIEQNHVLVKDVQFFDAKSSWTGRG